jgi:hypothetical protein
MRALPLIERAAERGFPVETCAIDNCYDANVYDASEDRDVRANIAHPRGQWRCAGARARALRPSGATRRRVQARLGLDHERPAASAVPARDGPRHDHVRSPVPLSSASLDGSGTSGRCHRGASVVAAALGCTPTD